jgi:serine/threonine-protein kinase
MSTSKTGTLAKSRGIVWTIGRRLGMVVLLGLAFILSATITIYLMFRSGETRVPNVVGKTESEAVKVVEDAGLKVRLVRRADEAIPLNTVIETRPAANASVKRDSGLTIIVSTGPAQNKSQLANPYSGNLFLISNFSVR